MSYLWLEPWVSPIKTVFVVEKDKPKKSKILKMRKEEKSVRGTAKMFATDNTTMS